MTTLTSTLIQQRLQEANCCAVQMGGDIIDARRKGKICEKEADIELILAIVDSIKGFVPEGEIISGTQAKGSFEIIGSTPGSEILTIGSVTYTIPVTGTDETPAVSAFEIAEFVNNLFPDSHPYSATLDDAGTTITFQGSNYDSDNGTAISFTEDAVTIGGSPTGTLTGGVASVAQGTNGITNEEVEHILGKLKRLCDKSCLDSH